MSILKKRNEHINSHFMLINAKRDKGFSSGLAKQHATLQLDLSFIVILISEVFAVRNIGHEIRKGPTPVFAFVLRDLLH